MSEEWRDVVGYEGFYQVSNKGRVRTVSRTVYRKNGSPHTVAERILRSWGMGKGQHQFVGLYKVPGERAKITAVHRLVLESFVGPCPNNMECCHGDGNAKNNELSNLRWDTRSENQLDSVRHGTKPQGSNHYRAKLKPEDIPVIRKLIAEGKSLSSIGRQFKVPAIAISCVRDRITWKHVS